MGPKGVDYHKWWREAIIYQIYPASFLDSNGDGWGDIPGITSKLDYLKELGVDILWLSPIYKSPKADMGYDIADYKSIDPLYGSLEDVDKLIAELKSRDMRLVMDLVVNHTSNEHPWFLESRSSKTNPKRDWYIWKSPKSVKDGVSEPPNNWAQILGEANSAWTYDAETGDYYLSLFTPEQPDLNWENPEVRAAVHDVLRFWLDRGASGFRMDVINLISKVQSYADAEIVVPSAKFQSGHKFFANGPRLYEFLKEMRREVLSKYDTITVGEMPFVRDEDEISKIVNADDEVLNMIFAFDLVDIDTKPGDFKFSGVHKWRLTDLKGMINRLQRLMIDRNGWNSLFLENHDNPRSITRFADDSDQWREKGSKLLSILQTTLCGTLYVYQGEELGQRNVPPTWGPEEYKDVEAVNFWQKANDLYPGNTQKLADALKVLQKKARDNARVPVQWDSSSPNAGFCPANVTPWMRINDDYKTVNAAIQASAPTSSSETTKTPSVYHFWKQSIARRKAHKEALVYGDFTLLDEANERVFAYKRTGESEAWVVVLNFSGEEVEWDIPAEVEVLGWKGGNYGEEEEGKGKKKRGLSGRIGLRPWEAVVGLCEV